MTDRTPTSEHVTLLAEALRDAESAAVVGVRADSVDAVAMASYDPATGHIERVMTADWPDRLATAMLASPAWQRLVESIREGDKPVFDPKRPWDHPYETRADNTTCRHCDWQGSYAHTEEFYRKWVYPALATRSGDTE